LDFVAEGVSKRFGATVALRDVAVRFRPGEIHAVVGENGAGKSTLASVLAGFTRPDSGSVSLDGTHLPLGRPFAFKRLGVEMVHQHFTLVPEFTVAENLALSKIRRLSSKCVVDELAEPALQVGQRLGWEFDRRARVESLSVGAKQKLEILKVLAGDPKAVIFDEPTAVLSQEEVGELFGVLRSLRDQGRTVLLIAHKLSEVMVIADRVTVLRKGIVVATECKGAYDANQLAKWMVGEMPAMPASVSHRARSPGVLVEGLRVVGDRGQLAVDGVDFQISRGEILGVGGVDGNGQLELAEAVAGVRSLESGSIRGAEKVGYVPQDRIRDGLGLNLTVAENMLATALGRPDFRAGPFLRMRKILGWAAGLIAKFEIAAFGPTVTVSALSGGNQQKVVVSRVLDSNPDLLVVSGPSRGLDVRATAFVWQAIRSARERGTAILLFSAHLEELSELADRVLFMSGGKLVGGSDAAAVVGGSV
jgi:ABC-type uncharacterized transport system ATPase subunit